MIVGIELTDTAMPLEAFKHPRSCVYLLGAEDHGLTNEALVKSQHIIKFNTPKSLNVAVAGSIIMYDRSVKGTSIYLDGKAV